MARQNKSRISNSINPSQQTEQMLSETIIANAVFKSPNQQSKTHFMVLSRRGGSRAGPRLRRGGLGGVRDKSHGSPGLRLMQ